MKRILLLMTFVVCACCSVWADPACPTTTASLTAYEGMTFVCNNLTFSDLTYIPSGNLLVDAGQVSITFVNSGGEEGLDFNAPWVDIPGQTTDSTFGFTVSCNDGCGIDDLALSILGAAAGPGGNVNLAEDATPPVGPTIALEADVNPGFALTSDSTTFSPVSSLTVTKDLAVIGGTSGPGSGASQVQNLFSTTTTTVPEPSTVFLCMGLLGLV